MGFKVVGNKKMEATSFTCCCVFFRRLKQSVNGRQRLAVDMR